MAKRKRTRANANRTAAQERLSQLWEEHVRYEFSTRNTEDTLATMVEDAYVNIFQFLQVVSARTNYANSTLNASFRRCRQIRK